MVEMVKLVEIGTKICLGGSRMENLGRKEGISWNILSLLDALVVLRAMAEKEDNWGRRNGSGWNSVASVMEYRDENLQQHP